MILDEIKKILGIYYDPQKYAEPNLFRGQNETTEQVYVDETIRETNTMKVPNMHIDTETGFEATIGKGNRVVPLSEETQKKLVAQAGLKWDAFVRVRMYYMMGLTAEDTEKMFFDSRLRKTQRGYGIRTLEKMWPILTGTASKSNQMTRKRDRLRELKLKIKKL